MIRIAIVGASSLSLGKTIIDEIVQRLSDIDLELRLMSLHEKHIRLMAEYAHRTNPASDRNLRVIVGRESREVVDGADLVICIFDIGGLPAARLDQSIAGEFGIGHCIGDTLGPAAIMRCQRVIPVMSRLRQELAELAPESLLVNYVNPIGPVGISLDRQGWRGHLGMCGGPAEMIGSIRTLLLRDELDYRLAGTNHMSWLASLNDSQGKDLYPELKERILSADIAGKERARAEILQTFGYFCSESSGQLTDMLPWFRNSQASRDSYLGSGYAGETGAYLRVTRFLHRQLGQMDFLKHAEPDSIDDLGASLSRIIRRHAGLEVQDDDNPIFGNVINKDRQIPNLPPTAFVESTLKYEGGHWIPEHNIPIPESVLALSRRHNENNELMASAALSGNADSLVQAMCLDPLNSSNIGIDAIREMTYKYIELEAEWLPQYERAEQYPGIDIGELPRIDKTVLDGESFVDAVRRRKKR